MFRLGTFFLLASTVVCTSVAQLTGGKDYALSGSSVMWYPRPGALFVNPGEISRLHQTEFLLSTSRFSNLGSMSAAHFEPFFGTFVAGISNIGGFGQYSVGYGRLWYKQNTVGASLHVMPDAPDKVSLSIGSSAHFADSSTQNSGLHLGVSVVNLLASANSGLFAVHAGAAYWIKPDVLRIQAAFLEQVTPYYLLGVEVQPLPWVSFQIGTQSFKEVTGGVSFPLPYFTADLAAGRQGIVLSFNFRISDQGTDLRDRQFEMGMKAFQEQRYYDARQHSLTALQYDDHFSQARRLADQSSESLEANLSKYLAEAKTLETRGRYGDAAKKYSQVVRMDPRNSDARARLAEIEDQVKAYVKQLMATGDSLMDKKNYERAERVYEQALEIDSENELLTLRLQDLAVLLKQSTQSSLARAKAFFDRNQIDDAQREYERIIASEPRNAQARSGLDAIRVRRTNDILERGKTLFNEAKYFEAMTVFSEVLQRDDKNKEARTMFDKSREALLPETDKFFKAGLQSYVKEDYKAAIESWDKALLIQPQHQATLEYYKRAQEKLKAIERLEKQN